MASPFTINTKQNYTVCGEVLKCILVGFTIFPIRFFVFLATVLIFMPLSVVPIVIHGWFCGSLDEDVPNFSSFSRMVLLFLPRL